ncbi:hypothetical protein AVEN_214753-1, partial [Araneus ventricosus]
FPVKQTVVCKRHPHLQKNGEQVLSRRCIVTCSHRSRDVRRHAGFVDGELSA